ncbi:MAG TPA: hypothetical protein VGG42_05035 [Acidobacteriaceae bacterium]|jgi:hypothetical protein
MEKPGRILRALCAAGALLALPAGCHSPWIQCTIVNEQATPVSLVQMSYPGGTFGVQAIAPGASFHYRFRDLGDDQASLDFTDATHHDHKVEGPQLKYGQQGTLRIAIESNNKVNWEAKLTKRQ